MGDYEKAAPWSESSVKGCKRFIDRIWGLQEKLVDGDSYSKELETPFNRTIKKVSEDIEEMKFNTAIAALMTLLNEIYDAGKINKFELKNLLLILNPFAPHISEEIWERQGFTGMVQKAEWPKFDEEKCVEATVEIAVQINGKVKSRISIGKDMDKETVLKLTKEDETVKSFIDGKTIVKEIFVPGRLVNLVVK